jgi:hypothetical protein
MMLSAPGARRPGAWAWGTAPAVLLTMVLAAGCGGSDGLDTAGGSPSQSGPGATSSSPAVTPTTSLAPSASESAPVDPDTVAQSEVTADFVLYDQALTKALRTRNARVTELIRLSTAPRQAKDRSKIQTMRQRGIVFKGTPRTWVGAISVAGNRAAVQVCEKNDASWYLDGAGKLVGTRLDKWDPFEVRMLRRDGRWQVNLVVAGKKNSCKGAS